MMRLVIVCLAVFGLCAALYTFLPSSTQVAFMAGGHGVTYMMLAGIAGAFITYKATK